MSTGLAIPVFCVSLAGTLAATVVFARELDRLSERLGLSEGLHGILTALGADAPEIATAVAALLSSRSKIGVGVVVGSNVFNLAALLGLSAVVAGHVRIHRHGLLLNGAVALAVAGVATALVLGSIGAVVATVLLLAVFVPYVFLLAMPPRRGFLVAAVREEVEDLRTGEHPGKASRADAVVLAAALGAIVLGSVGMVHAAEDLGRRWGVIGPFETVDLNTRGGIEVHASRMGPAYERMGAERGQHDPWTPELVSRVVDERRALLPLERWEERTAWRDRMLMRLERARREPES